MSFRLSTSLSEKIRGLAERDDVPVSQVVRRLLHAGIVDEAATVAQNEPGPSGTNAQA